ncbi:MAG: hypothetical protein IKS92_09415 [Victivallales bacterium]|nr:hypothetical protein [Victivallales bacterium]
MPRQNKTEYDLHTVMAVCARSRRTIRRARVRRIDTMQIRKTVTFLFVLLLTVALFGLAREFLF